MTTPEAADTADASTSWRDQAVARSLDPARARAEKRVQRFLDAALELMSSSDNKDFTVQQVVERSGQSLRSFYQYFAGKHELLLALFEESVRGTAAHLAETIEGIDDPLEQLKAFLVEYYRICTPRPKGTAPSKGDGPNPAAIAEFAQQLLTEHPREAAEAFGPLVAVLDGILTAAVDSGQVRDDINLRRIAGVLLQEIMFSAFAATISGQSPREGNPTDLWDLVLYGIAKR